MRPVNSAGNYQSQFRGFQPFSTVCSLIYRDVMTFMLGQIWPNLPRDRKPPCSILHGFRFPFPFPFPFDCPAMALHVRHSPRPTGIDCPARLKRSENTLLCRMQVLSPVTRSHTSIRCIMYALPNSGVYKIRTPSVGAAKALDYRNNKKAARISQSQDFLILPRFFPLFILLGFLSFFSLFFISCSLFESGLFWPEGGVVGLWKPRELRRSFQLFGATATRS